MPSAPINGINLYYETQGSGDDVFVFAHGAGGNHLSWWNQVPAFAERGESATDAEVEAVLGHRAK